MKNTKNAKQNKIRSVLLVVGISLLCIVFYDTIGKQILDQAGIFRSIVRRFNPDTGYYTYILGVLTVCLIPVTVTYIVSILWLRKRRDLTGTAKYLIIGAIILSYQIFTLAIGIYNNLA